MLLSVPKSKPKSYAQAAGAIRNVSLLHTDVRPTDKEADNVTRIYQTRIYRAARSIHAYLLDITPCKNIYTVDQCVVELSNQHPKIHAFTIVNDGPTRYLEVYLDPKYDINDIKNTGVTFAKANVKILPCTAIKEESSIVRLKLSHLPMFVPEEVLAGLSKSLAIFGTILDIGITTHQATGMFMGTGYAVLDIYKKPGTTATEKFVPLSHQISWMEDTKEMFRATWNSMPTWCRFCHKDGHTKYECAESRARILCYACHEHGHRSFECSKRRTGKSSTKKSLQTKTAPSIIPEIAPIQDTVPQADTRLTNVQNDKDLENSKKRKAFDESIDLSMETDDDRMSDISQTESTTEIPADILDLSKYSKVEITKMTLALRNNGELRETGFGTFIYHTTHPSPSVTAVTLAQWSQRSRSLPRSPHSSS